ncbi:MAG: helix-turn-helix transcriptional regulator [Rhodoferax sp.]
MEDLIKKPKKSGSSADGKISPTVKKKALVQAKTIKTVARLLEILSVPPNLALSNEELCRKFYHRSGSNWHKEGGELSESELRNIQRYTKALSQETDEGPALIENTVKDQKGRTHKFYHKPSRVTHWLMTEETALNILLTRQILGSTFDSIEGIGLKEVSSMADQVAGANAQTQRIRQRLRVVPDWIGREPAPILPEVLKETFDAVANDRQLRFRYRHSTGEVIERTVSVQGLVAKDGSLYLLGTEGFSDMPSRGLPLHRFIYAACTNLQAQNRSDFDLDRYIDDSHKLSHALDVDALPIELRLRVAPETIYHFDERPLAKGQEIDLPSQTDGWSLVTVTLPYTILLVPFLLSMGGWIEVLEPQSVRNEMAKRVREMAAHNVKAKPV